MDKPILSVIISCFNQGNYLLELLNCFPDYHSQGIYEIIIVNDGSTDNNTLSILKTIEQGGIFVLHQGNQGVCAARNNGVEIAKGKYILPVDGDDKISVRFIYEAINILDSNSKYSVVYANGEYFGEKNGPWIIGEFNMQKLMLWNYIHISSVFRKSVWDKAKGYDPQANGLEDWDFWLSVAFNGGHFYYLDKSMFEYRIRSGSTNSSLTSERYRDLQEYIDRKHGNFLSKEYLSDHFISKFKSNKRLWLKLFLKVYFPNVLNRLIEKGRLDSRNIN